jgi:hypothetical protein
MLSGGVAFGWAALGGFVAGLVVFVFPKLAYAQRTKDYSKVTRTDVLVTAALILFYTGLAGFSTLLTDEATKAAAIKLGLGVQAIIKSITAAFREATDMPAPE